MLRIVSSALHELSGHVSAVGALARLVVQSDASDRVQADGSRIQARAEAAARIVRNVVAALRGSAPAAELICLNTLVEDVAQRRRTELEADGLRLSAQLQPRMPSVWIDAAAVRQIVLTCLDTAALAARRDGLGKSVELATLLEEDHVGVRVRHDGSGLPRSVLKDLSGSLWPWRHPRGTDLALSLGREVAAQHGGRLTARNLRGGGGELVLRLPRVLAGQLPVAAPGEASGPRRG